MADSRTLRSEFDTGLLVREDQIDSLKIGPSLILFSNGDSIANLGKQVRASVSVYSPFWR